MWSIVETIDTNIIPLQTQKYESIFGTGIFCLYKSWNNGRKPSWRYSWILFSFTIFLGFLKSKRSFAEAIDILHAMSPEDWADVIDFSNKNSKTLIPDQG